MPATVAGRRRLRRPWLPGSVPPALAAWALLMMRSLTGTVMLDLVQLISKLPSGLGLRWAPEIRRSRPKRPGSLTISTTVPSKAVAVMRAPGAPCALGQMKLTHCGGVLR